MESNANDPNRVLTIARGIDRFDKSEKLADNGLKTEPTMARWYKNNDNTNRIDKESKEIAD